MSDFNKGDLVILKSGGPVMTVADVGDYSPIHAEDAVKCVWFEEIKGTSTVKEYIFDPSNLEKYTKAAMTGGPLGVRRAGY